jgi:YebC/PmpR family DNA-binding regulatory protein
MSGHSKWANIKRKKGIKDQEKGKVFTKLSKLLTLSVLEGGGIADPEKNVRLRLMIEKAKANNMPKENIARAIDRAHSKESANLKEAVYEGFGLMGSSIIIVAATDNHNRTFNEVRVTLEKNSGKIGTPGSASYSFQKCGMVEIDKTAITEDSLMQFAEDIEAYDIESEGEQYTLYIPFEHIGRIKESLNDVSYRAEQYYRSQTSVKITDMAAAEAMVTLIDALENLDDVSHVFSNIEFNEELTS